MKIHKFSLKSNEKLKECHKDLQKLMDMAISKSIIDFGISEGYRSIERQYQLFNEGRSKIDGINKKGKHNVNPSLAVDIYVYHPDYELRKKMVYDKAHLAYVAGVIMTCARELKADGVISHDLRWGGNWDSDGVIMFDQGFQDFPHFELI